MSFEKLRTAIRNKIDEAQTPVLMECEVLLVDKAAETCEVLHLDSQVTYYDVQLKPFEDTKKGIGLCIFPKPGSLCTIAVVDQISTSAMFLNCSEIESIKLKMNGSELIVDKKGISLVGGAKMKGDLIVDGNVKLNGGTKGGVPVSGSISTKLNQLEADLNIFKGLFATLASAGSGSPTTPILGAQVAPFAAWAGKAIVPTTTIELENQKVSQ